MEEHAADLFRLSIAGFLGAATIAWWGVRKIIDRIDALERIMANEVKSLREIIHQHDIRLTRIESHCSLYHKDRVADIWRLDPDRQVE